MSTNVLDCQWCRKIFPLNEMFSVDACCEEHQERLLRARKCLNPKCGSLDTLEIAGVVDSSVTVRCQQCGQTSFYLVAERPNTASG